MKKITVKVHPDNKVTVAYTYGETVLLVSARTVWDTDSSIVTNPEGYRFRRFIREGEGPCSMLWEYRRI